ncbi:hypothetical protein SDC9_177902 [bioreactor metagenome]|uniref:Uncharacterized protein n=1 Tax=bioreactor metagenome TaxID=1076179 RepID=A0A645GU95_9ZZZZ
MTDPGQQKLHPAGQVHHRVGEGFEFRVTLFRQQQCAQDGKCVRPGVKEQHVVDAVRSEQPIGDFVPQAENSVERSPGQFAEQKHRSLPGVPCTSREFLPKGNVGSPVPAQNCEPR